MSDDQLKVKKTKKKPKEKKVESQQPKEKKIESQFKFDFRELDNYFNEELTPYINAKTMQLILLRQVLDFTILPN